MGKNHHEEEFELILLDSIDEAFSSVGENTKKLIYSRLEKQFMISRQEIPFRVDEFSVTLERIFGLSAQYLEILIMKNLHTKMRTNYQRKETCWITPNLTFSGYVKLMKATKEKGTPVMDLPIELKTETDVEVKKVG